MIVDVIRVYLTDFLYFRKSYGTTEEFRDKMVLIFFKSEIPLHNARLFFHCVLAKCQNEVFIQQLIQVINQKVLTLQVCPWDSWWMKIRRLYGVG